MKTIIICLSCFFLSACISSKKYPNSQPIVHSNDVDLPEELYLENRLSGCDEALAYMKHCVTPGPLIIDVLPELTAKPIIEFENNNLRLHSNLRNSQSVYYRFYISPGCFLNLDAQKVYDIFVQPKFHQRLKEVNEEVGTQGFNLGFNSIGYFGFQILEGKVVGVGPPIIDDWK